MKPDAVHPNHRRKDILQFSKPWTFLRLERSGIIERDRSVNRFAKIQGGFEPTCRLCAPDCVEPPPERSDPDKTVCGTNPESLPDIRVRVIPERIIFDCQRENSSSRHARLGN